MIYRRGSKVVALTGEVKMPDSPQGRSALDAQLVEDAWDKAGRRGAPYYFTWNVNSFALFQTHQDGVPFMDRRIEYHNVVTIRESDEVHRPEVQQRLKEFWEGLLERLLGLEHGQVIRDLPLDQRFIVRLEGALEDPILATEHELRSRWARDGEFRAELGQWMREEQGWELSGDIERLHLNLDRAARLSCYVLANKLVFYEVLRRRFRTLPPLAGVTPATTRELSETWVRRFAEAVDVSKDYETIFAAADTGSRLPFLSDQCLDAWSRFIDNIEEFDFTRLDYDVIGRMYENLIGPAERRRFGQFFTVPDVVDLINAFCIRSPDATVLDPASGGGTFLVRVYARLRFLARRAGQDLDHQQLLKQVHGVDIAAFPAQLSTINLAVRHLSDEPNYPRVAQRDFFDLHSGVRYMRLPIDEAGGQEEVAVDRLHAVVGNPPYIRQEDLTKPYKDRLAQLAAQDWRSSGPVRLSGRSDLYVHFFVHAGALLADGGGATDSWEGRATTGPEDGQLTPARGAMARDGSAATVSQGRSE